MIEYEAFMANPTDVNCVTRKRGVGLLMSPECMSNFPSQCLGLAPAVRFAMAVLATVETLAFKFGLSSEFVGAILLVFRVWCLPPVLPFLVSYPPWGACHQGRVDVGCGTRNRHGVCYPRRLE